MSTVQPSGDMPGDGAGSEPRGGPTALRMLLGAQLRRLREAARVSPEDAGYEIRASRSKISRLEHGRVGFKIRDVEDLLTLYGVTSESAREGPLALARQANKEGWWAQYGDVMPDWFEAYIGLEAAATLIRIFEVQFVPGLFQTESYARAVTQQGHQHDRPEDIERRVRLRMKRQDLLVAPDRPRVWSVMDEAALRRPVGGPDVMREQFRRLLEVARLRHVTLQVMPFSRGGHAAEGGSFSILRFSEPDLPDVVYTEQLTGALYLERRSDVDHYMEVMNRLSAEALPPSGTARFLRSLMRDT
jgi:transcriptional regulator with XRE-family HTH domain